MELVITVLYILENDQGMLRQACSSCASIMQLQDTRQKLGIN